MRVKTHHALDALVTVADGHAVLDLVNGIKTKQSPSAIIPPRRIPKDLSVSIEVGEPGSGTFESVFAQANVIAYMKRTQLLQSFKDCR